MSKIPASARELRNSAKHLHRQGEALRGDAAGGSGTLMLRFYGLECQLKELFLVHTMRRPNGDTSDIPEGTFGRSGHDIQAGLKALRIPCMLPEAPRLGVLDHKPHYGDLPRTEPRRGEPPGFARIEQAHQVWRYGIAHEGSDAMGGWLDALVTWLRTQR